MIRNRNDTALRPSKRESDRLKEIINGTKDSTQDLLVGFFLVDEAFAGGLAAAFAAGAFLVGAFFAAALALAGAVVLVTVFFAAPRLLAVVVFFAAVVFALPASAFLGAGTFFAVDVLDVVVFLATTGFAAALDLVVVDFVAGVFAFGFAAAAFGLAAGLFSLAADVSGALALGASLTRPEGPLGRTKTPFSVPVAKAFDNCVFCAAPISSLYSISTNFLICGRETP